MSEVKHNLLDEPLLRVSLPDGTENNASLPAVLAQLCAGVNLELAALQAHQQHAVYAFLVQLAAIALHRGGLSGPPTARTPNEFEFRSWLRALCGGREEGFCLYVQNLQQPAFLQPPVPEGNLEAFTSERRSPDELDILATAKNHDVKKSRIILPRPEHWVYALISLQTMQGYSGKSNYGISRMNGGFGSRPYVALVPTQRMGARFVRDVRLWLERRGELLQNYHFKEDGPSLLWLEAWDGIQQDSFRSCDPFYIEVCRRVRLIADGDRLYGLQASSQVKRLGPKDAEGDTGDLWTPVEPSTGKAFTASDKGFRYDIVHALLTDKKYDCPACVLSTEDQKTPGDWVFIGRVLVRGNKTEGLHERVVPIPVQIRRRLGSPAELDALRIRAQRQVARVAEVQSKILYPALLILLSAGEDERRSARDQRPSRFTAHYTGLVDGVFFETLWDSIDLPAETAGLRWDERLRQLAQTTLEEAIRSVPLPAARREKAVACAEITFNRKARQLMTDLYATGALANDRRSSHA